MRTASKSHPSLLPPIAAPPITVTFFPVLSVGGSGLETGPMSDFEDAFRAAVADAVLANQLRQTDGVILMRLLGFTRGHGGGAWPSHERLAKECECSRRTVIYALKRLRALGWVDWTHRHEFPGKRRGTHLISQTSNLYRLCIPEHLSIPEQQMFTVCY